MAGSSDDIVIYLKTKYKSLRPIKILVIPGQTIDVEEEEKKALEEKKAETAEAKAAKAAAKPTAKVRSKAKAKATAAAEVPVAEMSTREQIVAVMKKMRTIGKSTTKRSKSMQQPIYEQEPTTTTSKSRKMEPSNC